MGCMVVEGDVKMILGQPINDKYRDHSHKSGSLGVNDDGSTELVPGPGADKSANWDNRLQAKYQAANTLIRAGSATIAAMICTSEDLRQELAKVQARAALMEIERDRMTTIARSRAERIAELVRAMNLTINHFHRNQISGNFQGDDEHECWNALKVALEKGEEE